MATPGVQLDESYIRERDRMRAELDQSAQALDDLPVVIRGIAKAAYAVWRAVGVPIFATFTKTSADIKVGLDSFVDDKGYKITVTRDNDWWKDILQQFGYDQNTINMIDALIPENVPGPNIIHTLMVAMIVLNSITTIQGIVSATVQKDLFSKHRPAIPGAEGLLKASFVAPELHDTVLKLLRQHGYTDEAIRLLFVSQYQLYGISEARNMFYRGVLDNAGVDNRLSEMGFTPERIAELKAIFPSIPPIQDLIMMQAKEQFEPDMIAKFGLHSETPTEIYEWTRKLGLSDDWTTKYWGSHWVHPSYGQVMEMLHRRLIKPEDVWEWFRLVEIPPYWRKLLQAISYRVYTRVDARRMHRLGVLDDEELVGVYEDQGYDRAHAEKMAEWTVKYNLDVEKDLSRADILKGYEDGDLTVSETVQLLLQIGYREDHAAYLIWRIDNEKIRAARLDGIEYVKAQFLSHLIPETDARSRLLQGGVSQTRVNELIVKWKTVQISNTKLPSKTDLDKMLKAGVIDKTRYVQEMGFLGYRQGYIDLYYDLAIKAGE